MAGHIDTPACLCDANDILAPGSSSILPPRDAPVAEVPCRGLLPDAPACRNSLDLDNNPNGIQAGGLAS